MIAGKTSTASLMDRIAILLDELILAIKWDRPCILYAVYQSEYVKEDVQSFIRQSLKDLGNVALNYEVDKVHNDVALDLHDHPGRKRTVYFITGLSWGGGKGRSNAYHALNMHREYLVEEKIRSIFWLTKNEARLIPRYAPDFWAFRFNVIEFFDFPSKLKGKSTDRTDVDYQQSVEKILAKLEKNPRDILLQKRIARLYNKLGFFEDSLAHYYKALRISPKEINIWFDIADVYMKMDHAESTARILKKVSKMSGKDVTLLKKQKFPSRVVQRIFNEIKS